MYICSTFRKKVMVIQIRVFVAVLDLGSIANQSHCEFRRAINFFVKDKKIPSSSHEHSPRQYQKFSRKTN